VQRELTPRALLVRLGAATIVACALLATFLLIELLHAAAPAAIAPEPPVVPASSRQLVVVIVDALRWDHAVDPERMPGFARRMREHSHAEVWAGRVTMTLAAVLAMGAGQRGQLSEIVLNASARRARHNHLVENLRAAGKRSAVAGDETWVQMFGHFDRQTLDPAGLPLEVDNSQEILDAGLRLAAAPPRPELLVVHVISFDHQGHAHAVDSPRFRAFERAFDARLERFLGGLPGDSTVVVLSDHGARDNGAHGVDSPIERRTPLFAYGPGIRPGVALLGADQIDLAATFAVLLGVAGPTHGRGTALTELLAVGDGDAARIACADVHRLGRVAASGAYGPDATALIDGSTGAALCAQASRPDGEKLAAARETVRRWDELLDAQRGGSTRIGLIGSLAALFVCAAVAGLLARPALGARFAAVAYAALGLAAAGAAVVGLTVLVEVSGRPWNQARGAALWLANLPLLAALVRPSAVARLYERMPALLLLAPGVFALSFPTNTQLHAWILLLVLGLVWQLAPDADRRDCRWLVGAGRRPASRRLALFGLALAALLPLARNVSDPLPAVIPDERILLGLGLAVACLWLAGGARARDGSSRPLDLALACGLAVAAPLARRVLPPVAGIAALLALPIAAWWLARAGRRTLALACLFGSWALDSRDPEVLAVAAAALCLESLGSAVAADAEGARSPSLRPWAIASLTAALFAAAFLARVGVQRGLDFYGMDWGAGTFRHPDPSLAWIGVAVAWKYLASYALLVVVLGMHLPPSLRWPIVALFALGHAARLATLGATLFACRTYFWPSLRVFGDLGPTLLASLAGAALLLGASFARPARAGPE
jgi:hypothetical protein